MQHPRPPRLIHSLSVTYVSQMYMGASAILAVPAYIALLGLEAFGIVSLYLVLITWMSLLNFGLSSTLTREAARFRAGSTEAEELRQLLQAVERLFALIALVAAGTVALLAPYVVTHWLRLDKLDPADARAGLALVGVILGLRFMSAPYRAILIGLEDMRWVGLLNIAVTTFRTILVIALLWLVGPSLTAYFTWVLVIGVAETILLAARVKRLSPSRSHDKSLKALARHWRFTIGMGLSAALWVLATTADKAIVSGSVALADYSIFSIAVMAATAVELVVQPMTLTFGPRLTFLRSAERHDELADLYGKYTQLTAVFGFASAAFLAALSGHVLFAWADRAEVTVMAAPVLVTYACGNALLAVSAIPLQLQSADGKVRLHLIGTTLFLVALVSGLLIAVPRFGIVGAAATWLMVNAAMFVFYVPVAHRMFYRGSHFAWLRRNVLPAALAALSAGLLARALFPSGLDRFATLLALGAAGIFIFVSTAFASSFARSQAFAYIRAHFSGSRGHG